MSDTAACDVELVRLRQRVAELERLLLDTPAISNGDTNSSSHSAFPESESQLRLLAESIPNLVWSCRPDGYCEYLSRQWAEYTGIPSEEQLGSNWLSVLHPDDRERTYQAWMATLDLRGVFDIEYRIRRSDGVYRWFRTRASPVSDQQGVIQRWFGTCTDIDEQRVQDDERKLLLASEQQSRRVAELLNRVGPLLAAELDPQKLTQNITDLSTQLIDAEFGAFFHRVSGDKAQGFPLYTLSGAPRKAFAHFPVIRPTAIFGPTLLEKQTVRIADIRLDPRFGQNVPFHGLPAGHLPVVSYLATPVVSRSGVVLGALMFGHGRSGAFSEAHEQLIVGIAAQAAICLDNARLFAESQENQAALRRINDDLRRANEDLNQFAYSASHDLQEPLRMVAIYNQMLQRRYSAQLDTQANEYLTFSIEGAQRMQMLVRDLLAYTQAVVDDEEFSPHTHAEAALQIAWSNLARAVEESGAVLTHASLPALGVQTVHLVQIFQNLIGNSLKYRSAQKPLIHVTAEQEGTMWRLCVRDNGIGVPPQYAEQVFGIFKRLHGPGKYAGTGIGLAICQKIVQRYDGRIWVESEEGCGASFCFTLPWAAAEGKG